MKVFLLLFTVLTFSLLNAQDSKVCQDRVKEIVTAFNSKSASKVIKYLASDFTFLGQKSELSKMVFPEFIKQANDKIKSYVKKTETKSKNLTFIYEIVYAKVGKEKATFVFNKENQIVTVEFFKSKVQVIEK